MDELIANLKYGFANLTRFDGRDDRGRFWTYAGTILIVMMAGYMVALALRMTDLVYDLQHNNNANLHLGSVIGGVAILSVSVICLLASAVSRRLHDIGRSGFWGLMPVPFLAFGLVQMGRIIGAVEAGVDPDMDAFLLVFINNMIYLASLGFLVFLLVKRSSDGMNRFGGAPSDII